MDNVNNDNSKNNNKNNNDNDNNNNDNSTCMSLWSNTFWQQNQTQYELCAHRLGCIIIL